MPTSQLLDEATSLIQALGFEVRFDYLGGDGTGHCRLGQRRLMVIDVAQPVDEQLDRLCRAISSQPLPPGVIPSEELNRVLAGQTTTD